MLELQRERSRAVMADPETVGREGLARHLVENTTMSHAEIVRALRASVRSNDAPGVAEGIAATAGANIARALLGMKADPAADLAIGQRIAAAHAADAAERVRLESQRARDEQDFAEGRAAAERLRGRRH